MDTPQTAISPLQIRTGGGERIIVYHGSLQNSQGSGKLKGFAGMHALGDYGSMQFQFFSGNGFALWCSEYEIARPMDFITHADIGILELSIPLKANIYSSWDGLPDEFIRDEEFDLSYVPFISNRTKFKKPAVCRTFDIHYSRDYLDRFSSLYPAVGSFLEAVDRGEAASLTGRDRRISPAMKSLVRDMMQFDMSDRLAGYFYDASALLMLTMVMDRMDAGVKKHVVSYSAHEKESATEARNIVTENFSERYSIRDLARKTGTSETRLQQAFKYLYGTTIFDYAQSARLDYAKTLLLDTGFTIQSIAEHCGYPDNSNLTAAFRKRFGSSPEAFRTLGK
jgi:AraC-like DNA-binding protein